MTIRITKVSWMATGCMLAALTGAPAVADDTELLLINPDPSQNPTPNVMFILDTSGSMTTTETTIDPYVNTTTYAGDCDTDAIYWTDVEVIPVCDVSNQNFVFKSNYHCDFATLQIAGIGSYSNTMVQYRDGDKEGTGSGPATWQYLASGYNTEPVECEADRGVHGDGQPGFLWAANGTNLANPFTDNANNELSWGSAPRNLSYTFFDGNYLNWKASPANVDLERIDIMKIVVTNVLNSITNMNVGIMRFNDREGGPILKALTDVDTKRQEIIDVVGALDAEGGGSTPLSEVLYENALYWLGESAYYGETVNEFPTDPLALSSSSPEVYAQPSVDACAKSFNVYLSDGDPTDDEEGNTKVPTLPDFEDIVGRNSCTIASPALNEGGDCMDDAAEYLSLIDIDDNAPDRQSVITHTIGFTSDIDILIDTAAASGGRYFRADDVESLTTALLNIVTDINDRSQSFSAPAVSVNTFNRTRNLNDLYLTMFGASSTARWPGNLKKYEIVDRVIKDANGAAAIDPATGFFFETATSIWTTSGADGNEVRLGGAANRLPDPSVRNLYTNNGGGSNLTNSTNEITPSNAGAFAASDFGLTGAAGEPSKTDIIRWMRGEDVADEDDDATTTVRNAMGDPLHSQPAAIVYGGSEAAPDIVVYTATNDGYLHAIDGSTGIELWSFVPKELLTNMRRLFFNPAANFKQYGIDGDVVPIIKDSDGNGIINGSDFVYLIVGMRRGGDSYYALDVSDKNSPILLWQKNTVSTGETWAAPVIAKMKITGATQNADNAVVVLGGGYDYVHDTRSHPSGTDSIGAGITFLDLESGNTLWSAGSASSGASLELDKMTRSIPNAVRVVDISGDGLADRMYASDMGGQVWRFDIANGQPASTLVTGGVIARLGAEGLASPTDAQTRRFYSSPDVSLFRDDLQDRSFIAISIGSGYRAHPYDLSATDQFFSIRDPDVLRTLTQDEYDNYIIVTNAGLKEVAGAKQVVIDPTDRGWKFTLPANEKVLTESITFDDTVFFVSFSPDSSGQTNCSAGRGTNFLYRVSVLNGDPIVNNLDTLDPADADDARRETLAQGGIAPTPTVLFPSPADPDDCTGDECTPPPIMCVGLECSDPNFRNFPIRTLWTQDGIQ